MGEGRQGTVVQRIAAVAAGGLLVSMAFAGPAFADTTTPSSTAPTTTSSTAAPTTTISSESQLSPFTSEASGSMASPNVSASNSATCQQLASQLTSLFNQIADQQSKLNTLTNTLGGLTDNTQITDLQTSIANLQAQANTVSEQLAKLVCSLGLPTTPGTEAETIFAAPQVFGANATTTSRTPTTAFATQVASVPTGGVNTGDGSFGE